jgi:hypothetical protein
MVPSSEDPAGKKAAPGKKKPAVRTKTPRPDELTRETFEFIAAVDDYKRKRMRSFLDDEEALQVLLDLGYVREDFTGGDGPTPEEVAAYTQKREEFRHSAGRLFPTWSEIFELFVELGYRRTEPEEVDAS